MWDKHIGGNLLHMVSAFCLSSQGQEIVFLPQRRLNWMIQGGVEVFFVGISGQSGLARTSKKALHNKEGALLSLSPIRRRYKDVLDTV